MLYNNWSVAHWNLLPAGDVRRTAELPGPRWVWCLQRWPCRNAQLPHPALRVRLAAGHLVSFLPPNVGDVTGRKTIYEQQRGPHHLGYSSHDAMLVSNPIEVKQISHYTRPGHPSLIHAENPVLSFRRLYPASFHAVQILGVCFGRRGLIEFPCIGRIQSASDMKFLRIHFTI